MRLTVTNGNQTDAGRCKPRSKQDGPLNACTEAGDGTASRVVLAHRPAPDATPRRYPSGLVQQTASQYNAAMPKYDIWVMKKKRRVFNGQIEAETGTAALLIAKGKGWEVQEIQPVAPDAAERKVADMTRGDLSWTITKAIVLAWFIVSLITAAIWLAIWWAVLINAKEVLG